MMERRRFATFLCLQLFACTAAYKYVVTTFTGDRFGAGTDARVFVKFFGDKGETEERELQSNGRDNFERGQLDTFLLDTNDVGRIRKANIRHDNSWLGPGWYLEKLTVTTEDGDYYEFPVNKWLDQHQEDGKTNRELIPRPVRKAEPIDTDEDQRQPLDCSWPQGIGNGKITDDQMTASTSFNDLHLPYHARLGQIVPASLGGWCPYKDDKDEYLQIDLGEMKKISGIATQGMGLVDEWTTSYRMMYSNKSEKQFREYSDNGIFVKNFVGNDDQNGTVLHWLRNHVVGRYFRIYPLKWHGKGCLRLELYGCPAIVQQSADDYENSAFLQSPPSAERPANMDAMDAIATKTRDSVLQPENESLDRISGQHADMEMSSEVPVKETEFESREQAGSVRAISSQLSQRWKSNALSVDVIPVVHLDFDEIRDTLIPDVSGHHNDAHFRRPIDILSFSKSCERGVRLNGGDVFFDGEFFIDKPREEITVAAWIKLYSNGGQHSIFDTVGGKESSHKEGQYHFEVDRGRLRWFHRNEGKETVFNISTPLMVPAHIWTHCAATYASATGQVSVYVNGKLGQQGYGIGMLSQDWSGRAGIGKHKSGRILNGEIDEFYIFNKALTPSKVQMLMKRCSFETDCQAALGMQSKQIKDSQISASSTYNLHKPYYGRINLASFWGDPARTAWCAVKDDKNPYLEMELDDLTSITGVATQGLSIFDNWVTSYLFCYSEDKAAWNCYKEKGYDKIFEGNSDKNSIKRHYFHHAVSGKYVRIRPQSWYGNHLCMRAEIYGCLMDLNPDPYDSFGSLPVFMEDTEAQTRGEISPKESCNNPLGVSNGEVDDMRMTASTSMDDIHLPYYGRLVRDSLDQSNIRGCWCARDVNLRQFIEADLGEVKTITGIATQGYVSHDNWVASYRLGFSDESSPLEWYRENDDEKLFLGNVDRTGIVKHFLKHPVQARYLRLNPRAWHGIHICMRFELFGCMEGGTKNDLASLHDVSQHLPSRVRTVTAFARDKSPYSYLTLHKKEAQTDRASKTHVIQRTQSGAEIAKGHEVQHHRLASLPEQLKGQRNGEERKRKALRQDTAKARMSDDEVLRYSYPQPKIIRPSPKLKIRPVRNFTIPFNLFMKPHKNMVSQGRPEWVHFSEHVKPQLEKLKKGQQNLILQLASLSRQPKHEKALPQLTLSQLAHEASEGDPATQSAEGGPDISARPLSSLSDNDLYAGADDQESFVKNSDYSLGLDYDENCRRGTCLQSTGYVPTSPNLLEAYSHSPNLASMFPKERYPQSIQLHSVKAAQAATIDAKSILKNFPELRQNGITEHVLNSLAERVPNLEERIYAHFALKHVRPDVYTNSKPVFHDLTTSNIAFIKNYQDALRFSKGAGDLAADEKLSSLLPSQHRVSDDSAQDSFFASNGHQLDGEFERIKQQAFRPRLHSPIKYPRPKFRAALSASSLSPLLPNLLYQGQSNPIFEKNNQYSLKMHDQNQPGFYFGNPAPESSINSPSPYSSTAFPLPFNAENMYPSSGIQYGKPMQPLSGTYNSQDNLWNKDARLTYPQPFMSANEAELQGVGNLMPGPGASVSHPCRRNGNCFGEEGESADETLVKSLPHSEAWYPAASNGILPQNFEHQTAGPDPRFADYYQSYLAGKSFEEMYQPSATSEPKLAVVMSPDQEVESLDTHTYSWTPFSVCSAPCGRGEKRRYRRCRHQDCPTGGAEVESVPCAEDECPEISPYEWSPYTPCSTTCGTGRSVRYRLCNAQICPDDGYETEQITCYNPSCPVCLLDFEVVTSEGIVMDQSGYNNNAALVAGAKIREHPQICGHYIDMTNQGTVILPDKNFIAKPRTGITIAAWVNIQGDLAGKHSVFNTVRMIGPDDFIGGYHFEIDDGKVRWFHREESGRTVFSMLTNVVTQPRVWMHYAATYDGYKGIAKVYVDGKERGSTEGEGLLAEDWGYKACIGGYDFDDRRLQGWLDEFIMYEFPLSEEQVFALLGKMRCPTSNYTTIEIDAFKFQTANFKRSVLDSDGLLIAKALKLNTARPVNNSNNFKRSEVESRQPYQVPRSAIMIEMKNASEKLSPTRGHEKSTLSTNGRTYQGQDRDAGSSTYGPMIASANLQNITIGKGKDQPIPLAILSTRMPTERNFEETAAISSVREGRLYNMRSFIPASSSSTLLQYRTNTLQPERNFYNRTVYVDGVSFTKQRRNLDILPEIVGDTGNYNFPSRNGLLEKNATMVRAYESRKANPSAKKELIAQLPQR